RDKAQRRRADKLAKLDALLTARNAFVQTEKRAKPAARVRSLRVCVQRQKPATVVQVSLDEGQLTATLETTVQAEAAQLEGCYVLETDVSQPALDAQAVPDRYRDLHEVEQDVRTMKTGLFVRKARRTRAHV